ncbi:MAG: HAD hydrolase family protein, partial [Pyrinomonadaceae bacterium]
LGVLVYDHLNGDNQPLLEYIRWAKRIYDDEGQESVREVPSLDTYLDHSPLHLAFSGSCEAMRSLARTLQEQLSTRVKVFCTNYPKRDFALVDIVHPLASKGAGVAAAAAELVISRDEVMAVGDNLNDLEMLEFAGTPVVMENAEPELRVRADFHVTVSNDADGVAIAIERFILSQ